MKISASQLQMQASHLAAEQREASERLRMWTGERPNFEGRSRAAPPPPIVAPDAVSLSREGHEKSAEARAIDAAREAVDTDPMLALLRGLLSRIFGIEVQVFDAHALGDAPASQPGGMRSRPEGGAETPQAVGFGIEYDYHEVRAEHEETRFAVQGEVRTADGRTIAFSVALEMSRTFVESSDVSLRLGDAARTRDPLVINFSGTAAQLSDRSFRIDLDGDGQQDEARFVASGSGFLVFDRNADGRIDQTAELFGPRTGDAFAELAALDTDGNGWIDGGDADYGRLQVWSRDATGTDRLQSLQEAKVGAISLARLTTPFALKDSGNTLLGEVRSSGVYLSEDGEAGTVQQIDLAV